MTSANNTLKTIQELGSEVPEESSDSRPRAWGLFLRRHLGSSVENIFIEETHRREPGTFEGAGVFSEQSNLWPRVRSWLAAAVGEIPAQSFRLGFA